MLRADPQYPLVHVTWFDSWSTDAWTSVGSLIVRGVEGALIETVGLLLNKTSTCVLVAGNYDPDTKQASNVICIPAKSVADLHYLTHKEG